MKVVDKEQERVEAENSPAGKRKKWLELLAALVFFLVCAGLYRVMPNFEIGAGKPYVIVMDGLEITPGKTTVQDLADAGYALSDSGAKIMASEKDENGNTVFLYRDVYDLDAQAEGRTLYSSLVLVKGELQAADISIINNGASDIPLSQCIVSNVTIRNSFVDADKVMVEGAAFPKLTEEKITELFGKKERVFNVTTSIWERGKYYFSLDIAEDGTVKKLTTERYYRTDALEKYQK